MDARRTRDRAYDDAVFARCAQRRRGVADLIESLDDAQLVTPSLCSEWDVRSVAGHLVVPLVCSPVRIAGAVLRHRGNFGRANTELARTIGRAPVSQLAAWLREHAENRVTPPLHGPAAPLTDLCVHTADIRVPLGMAHDITPDDAATAFDLLTGFSMFFIPRGLLGGIRLAPDDLDRTWGDGAPLTGSAGGMLLAVTGRAGFLDRMAGAGRDLLEQRRPTPPHDDR